MRSAWIVVANASRARLFERLSEHGHIEPLASIEDAEGLSPARALLGGARTELDAARERRLGPRLARRVADYLNDGVLNDRCARLQLFASASMLGAIREYMHGDTVRVSAEHATPDLTACSTEELEQRIADLCGTAR